jgi:hypothetical protein
MPVLVPTSLQLEATEAESMQRLRQAAHILATGAIRAATAARRQAGAESGAAMPPLS